jgi:hypothetical protein
MPTTRAAPTCPKIGVRLCQQLHPGSLCWPPRMKVDRDRRQGPAPEAVHDALYAELARGIVLPETGEGKDGWSFPLVNYLPVNPRARALSGSGSVKATQGRLAPSKKPQAQSGTAFSTGGKFMLCPRLRPSAEPTHARRKPTAYRDAFPWERVSYAEL